MNPVNIFSRNISRIMSSNIHTCTCDKGVRKVLTTKRLYDAGRKNAPVAVEQKDAAEVIKRLNAEFKSLFGPVVSSKGSSNSAGKLCESDQIIQQKTSIPIVEPEAKPIVLKQSVQRDTLTKKDNLDLVLNFPLVNSSSLNSRSELEISQLNLLRKYLEEKSPVYVPSVSAILEKTMSPESAQNLKRWKENMIQKLGEEGFKKYHEELLANGSSLHASINHFLSSTPGDELHVVEANAGHWKSLTQIFPKINEVKLLEERVSHPFLHYKGIVDCFAKYREHLVVIDWKTSKKRKTSLSSTFDNPLQIAAYVGALNFDPKFQYLANKGLIVVAYKNGEPASPLFIDEDTMQRYWKEWLGRVKLYWELTDKN